MLIVSDNTNSDSEVRSKWIDLATKHAVPIRCIHFTTSLEGCSHNDVVRALNSSVSYQSFFHPPIHGHLISTKIQPPSDSRTLNSITKAKIVSQMNPEKRTILSSLAFRAFTSKFQSPEAKEGFQDVVEWDFKVNLFLSLSFHSYIKRRGSRLC